MSIDTTATETKVETIATPPEIVVTPTTTVDYEAVLANKEVELQKTREEKDNYRKAYLKGKSTGDDTSETNEEMVRRITREELLNTKEAQLVAEKDSIIKNTLKRNKELELALKNRGQILSTSGEGSNTEKPEGKADNYLSNEQLSALKAKGWDDKKIEEFKKNAKKVSQMPK